MWNDPLPAYAFAPRRDRTPGHPRRARRRRRIRAAAAGRSLSSLARTTRPRHTGPPPPKASGRPGRDAGQGRRQAAALTAEALAAIRATAAATAARVPPDGRNPLRRPGSGEPWTWLLASVAPSPRVMPPCSGAPKTDEEGEGAVQYLGKGTAAALREIRPENPDPDARVFGLRSGRSVAAASPPKGRRARRRVLRGVGMARAWPPGPPSPPSRSPARRMPAHYARGELAARGAVARFYGE